MEIRYPELKTRVQSTFIDVLLMVVLMFLAAWILDKLNLGNDENSGLIRAIVFISIWGIYEPLATTFGATLGNYLMKIRVRKESAYGKKINVVQAFVRFVFKFALGWLSFLTIHFSEQRRAIHDIFAGSVMVEK